MKTASLSSFEKSKKGTINGMRKIRAVTTKTIKALDRRAIHRIGIPSAVLMENAGRAVASTVCDALQGIKHPRVNIFSGLGNNAGDGFVAARHLSNAKIAVTTFLLGNPRHFKNDALLNYQILKDLKLPAKHITHIDEKVRREICRCDVIVDAIFGVGLNRAIQGLFKDTINAMNQSGKPVISVDIPSGLDGTTGKIYGVCVKAAKTVTFSFAKRGFFRNEGPRHVGKVIVCDIGIPEDLTKRVPLAKL